MWAFITKSSKETCSNNLSSGWLMIFRSKNSLVEFLWKNWPSPKINVKSGLLGFDLGILNLFETEILSNMEKSSLNRIYNSKKSLACFCALTAWFLPINSFIVITVLFDGKKLSLTQYKCKTLNLHLTI